MGTLITKVDLIPVTESSFLSLDGQSRHLFSIDGQGRIKTEHRLDYETQPYHWLSVIAKSHLTGQILARMELFINVTDANECVPLTKEPSYR